MLPHSCSEADLPLRCAKALAPSSRREAYSPPSYCVSYTVILIERPLYRSFFVLFRQSHVYHPYPPYRRVPPNSANYRQYRREFNDSHYHQAVGLI